MRLWLSTSVDMSSHASRTGVKGDEMADDAAHKVEARVLPEDEQINEMVRMFAALTPDQRATVRALMQADEKLRESK